MGGPRGRMPQPPDMFVYGPGLGRPLERVAYRSPNAQGTQPQPMGYGPGMGSRAGPGMGMGMPMGMMDMGMLDMRPKQAPYGPTFGTRNTVRSEKSAQGNKGARPSAYQTQDGDAPFPIGRRPNNMASANPVPIRALYSIGAETPIKGKEKEYAAFKEAMKNEPGYEDEPDRPQVSPDGGGFAQSPAGSALPLINDLPALLARAAELEAQIVPVQTSAETVRQRANALFQKHMSEIDVTAEIQPDLDKIRADCLKIVEKQKQYDANDPNVKIERMRSARSAMIEVAIEFADAIAALDDLPRGPPPSAGMPAQGPGVPRPPEAEARATGSGFGGEPSGFGVETPIPGREAEYKGDGGMGGNPGGAYTPPEIDDSRTSRSPGISTNFYDLSTADFKKPFGTRRQRKRS